MNIPLNAVMKSRGVKRDVVQIKQPIGLIKVGKEM
jgi:hypothetical protein